MARDQAYCAGCKKAFGLTARRSYYNGLQFHHIDFNNQCVENYKEVHPPTYLVQRIGRKFVDIVLAPFRSWKSEATTEVPHAADD